MIIYLFRGAVERRLNHIERNTNSSLLDLLDIGQSIEPRPRIINVLLTRCDTSTLEMSFQSVQNSDDVRFPTAIGKRSE
jgi:hypothetical protein